MVMVFSATFNTISVTPWSSVLLVEETGISGKTTHLPHVFVYINPGRCRGGRDRMVVGFKTN
jgi:hypothetical protein